jgi:hypothetical protein
VCAHTATPPTGWPAIQTAYRSSAASWIAPSIPNGTGTAGINCRSSRPAEMVMLAPHSLLPRLAPASQPRGRPSGLHQRSLTSFYLPTLSGYDHSTFPPQASTRLPSGWFRVGPERSRVPRLAQKPSPISPRFDFLIPEDRLVLTQFPRVARPQNSLRLPHRSSHLRILASWGLTNGLIGVMIDCMHVANHASTLSADRPSVFRELMVRGVIEERGFGAKRSDLCSRLPHGLRTGNGP